jgi:hypothetical protein
MNTNENEDILREPTPCESVKAWFEAGYDSIIFRFYKKTSHYWEGRMHDALLHDLLTELGAPHYPSDDPKRPRYGPYGRLNAWAVRQGLVKEKDWKVR